MRRPYWAFLIALWASTSQAINIRLDYTYDTNGFFGAGNPAGAAAGAQAKAALEAAASYFSEILGDSFSPISTPAAWQSPISNASYEWYWTASFDNPATGGEVVLNDPTIAADEYVVYAGGRSIPGTTLGIGGPGGVSRGGSGSYSTPQELEEIESISDAFFAAVDRRGEPAGDFGSWGGSITFDSDTQTVWHWDHLTDVEPGENDFYSVAIHELGHALGFGSSEEWIGLVDNGQFLGSNAYFANGNVYPSTSGGHWKSDTQSTVYGSSQSQEAAMDPSLTQGSRKHFTTLDAAGLADIGWEVAPPEMPLFNGDVDGDGDADGVDFLLWQRGDSPTPLSGDDLVAWQTNYGRDASVAAVPEPATYVLVGLLALVGVVPKRR